MAGAHRRRRRRRRGRAPAPARAGPAGRQVGTAAVPRARRDDHHAGGRPAGRDRCTAPSSWQGRRRAASPRCSTRSSAHASRPLHVWVLSPAATAPGSPAAFPELAISWVPSGPWAGAGGHLRPALLPALMPGAERVVVLPLPAVATADVAELADLELGPHALAAPTGTADTSGFGVVNTAANRLRDQPGAASELRRAALARHAFDFDAFATASLVLDLARLRGQRSVAEGLALADAFRLSDREVLHLPGGAGAGHDPGALGGRADPHAGARPGPAPLGRPRQAVARAAHPRTRAVAPPRRDAVGPPRPAAASSPNSASQRPAIASSCTARPSRAPPSPKRRRRSSSPISRPAPRRGAACGRPARRSRRRPR